jgi:hypothetical protein
MFKKTMFLALALALTTVLAPAALAGHDDFRNGRPDRLVVLADDLVDATRHIRRNVKQQSRGHNRRSGDLLYSLDRLARQARHFRNDALQGASPRHLDREFDELLVAFNRADRRMCVIRSRHLQRDFEQVAGVMRRLARNVQIATGPGPRRGRGGVRGGIVLDRAGRDGLHGSIVLGDERREVRIRF